MKEFRTMRLSMRGAALLPVLATLALATALFAQSVFAQAGAGADGSQAGGPVVQDQCTFSDGGTISFGRKAAKDSDGSVWRAGKYHATSFRVSERMILPPLDHPVEIPRGRYTLFVDTSGGIPWTLIISRRTGGPGSLYPGEQYDVGRAAMGSDVSPRAPANTFVIGCTQSKDAPIFVWIESGTQIALAKIMAETTRDGQPDLLWH